MRQQDASGDVANGINGGVGSLLLFVHVNEALIVE